ncbi:MAG: hypothetical protein M1833_004798 [Piccolia ochrophora]|nr:MAG: hypothetical protein M1833_004798 [Piccolia ochrophora]
MAVIPPFKGVSLLSMLLVYVLTLIRGCAGDTTSTVNGRAEYMGTPVETNPVGIPTLIYNCAKMPSICKNVGKRYPMAGGLLSLPNGKRYLELNWDTDKARTKARGAAACGNNWKARHPCPEPGQPEVVPKGSWVGQGSFIGKRLYPFVPVGEAGSYTIESTTVPGASSGMAWTCDEFPPKIALEGGADANTVCAPQSVNCDSTARKNGVVGVNGEQDYQKNGHQKLGLRVASTTKGKSGVFTFHFHTMYEPGPDSAVLQIEYHERADTGLIYPILSTRDEQASSQQRVKVIEHHFANGTEVSFGTWVDEVSELVVRQAPSNANKNAPCHQNLQLAPPVHVIENSAAYMVSQVEGSVTSTDNATSDQTGNLPRSLNIGLSSGMESVDGGPLLKRDGPLKCGANQPCEDDSCCSAKGTCGYEEANCGAGCVSNCEATAMCGKRSEGGAVKCGLNICCSYYGWCGVGEQHCVNAAPPKYKKAPCQAGFGLCEVVPPPVCGQGSGSASGGRKIGYYQASNVRDRACNRITPSQINTAGLTHLFYAFANIDPSTFQVAPSDPADTIIYREVTALKTPAMQTWIAIGGFDFSNEGPTRTTWSDMSSNEANRAAFITSLVQFMDQYGFQGVDLDWEYPVAPERGGKKGDTANLVALVTEMRAAFGTKYGISLALAPDYWYLRHFDPKGMEPSVDFFGFMAYDLHGSWDADVDALGSKVRPHTDIRDINNNTLPLWFDALDPAKINFGVAYYGRGYTLSDPACSDLECGFSGASKPALCTNFGGVMSNIEIETIIKEKALTPKLIPDAMVKQISWDDQWIGYDDAETVALKVAWANDHCMGGTMVWSVDFNSGPGSGNTPDGGAGAVGSGPGSEISGLNGGAGAAGNGPGLTGGAGAGAPGDNDVYIDPIIWTQPNPIIQCQPPCRYILPPYPLGGVTTISFPPLSTSLAVALPVVRTVTLPDGSVSLETGRTTVTQATVINIPPVTTSAIEVYAFSVSDKDAPSLAYTVTRSILPPPFTITDDPGPLIEGVTQPPVIRTIFPPVYPYPSGSGAGGGPTPAPVVPSVGGPTPTDGPPPGQNEDTDDDTGPPFPVLFHKPGVPGPLCIANCGKACKFFCSGPCLLSCSENGEDFGPPGPPPGGDNPGSGGGADGENTEEEDEEEEEEEEEDDACKIEVNPEDEEDGGEVNGADEESDESGDDPIPPKPNPDDENNNDGGDDEDEADAGDEDEDEADAGDEDTGDEDDSGDEGTEPPDDTVVPTITVTLPQVTVTVSRDPNAPTPDPNTEEVECNSGSWVNRGEAINALYAFCETYDGTRMTGDDSVLKHWNYGQGNTVDVKISVTVTNGCDFKIEGNGDDDTECGRILRRTFDECNTDGVNFKRGGTVTSNCAIWALDPTIKDPFL